MKIAVAIMHGIGSQRPGFSLRMQQSIAHYYQKQDLIHQWDDIIFQEIVWSDILASHQETLFQRLTKNNALSYVKLRRFFIDYLADIIAYQPGCVDEDSEPLAIRELIHARVNEAINAFVSRDDIDEEKTPLVLIGHSLGSVILFNHLFEHQRENHASAFSCGYTLCGFITLGSPIALWSLRYKHFGRPFDFPGKNLSNKLKQKARWLNFFDKDDVVAYPIKPINALFNKAVDEDIETNVGSLLTSWNPLSHMAYFDDKDIHLAIAQLLTQLQKE